MDDHAHDPHTDGHDHSGDNCPQCQAPSGSSQYGWIWVVGIIIVVAIALYFLQRNVPETATEGALPGPTAEETLPQTPGVYNVSVPDRVPVGAIFAVDWDVSAAEATTISHTAVHWGAKSGTVPDDYPNATQEYYKGSFAVPGHFETNVQAPREKGVIYLRAHAVVGDTDYVSDEFVIPVE